MNPQSEGDRLFGAFKGRRKVEQGYVGLMRLIWACQSEDQRWSYPATLTRRLPPLIHEAKLPLQWRAPLKSFLNGRSDRLLSLITVKLLENTNIPAFEYRVIQDDLENVKTFYETGPLRNRALKKYHRIKKSWIAQEEIDDLLVLERARVKL